MTLKLTACRAPEKCGKMSFLFGFRAVFMSEMLVSGSVSLNVNERNKWTRKNWFRMNERQGEHCIL